jgi:hypothetical protein
VGGKGEPTSTSPNCIVAEDGVAAVVPYDASVPADAVAAAVSGALATGVGPTGTGVEHEIAATTRSRTLAALYGDMGILFLAPGEHTPGESISPRELPGWKGVPAAHPDEAYVEPATAGLDVLP